LEKAHELFQDMLRKGYATTLSFHTLIDGFCKSKMLQEASHLLEEMLQKKIMPENVTYAMLIDQHR
jgi:leucine-rich PPR motif-containing protein